MYNKSLSIIACAALAVLSASCSKESVTGTDGEAGVSFTIEVPGAPATKAIGDGETAKTLYYQVFDSKGDTIKGLGAQTAKLENKTATVKFQLMKEQNYTFVFWAQTAVDGYYTIGEEGLKKITANYTGKSANDENFDAFYAVEKLAVNGPVTKSVTLKRPFAQINIGSSDKVKAGDTDKAIDLTGATSTFTVKNLPTTFSPITGTFEGAETVTFAAAAVPTETLTVGSVKYSYLAMNYVFASQRGTVYDIEAKFSISGMEDVNFKMGSVPAKGNWRTNIVGNVLTSGADFNITVDPVFEGDVSPQTGYKDKNGVADSLPKAPKVVGNVMNVTAANAQYTLDGAYGSISGKTINFTESITEPLVFARPTKYYGSNTKYMVGGFDSSAENYQEFATAEEISAYKARTDIWTPYCCYARTINDVKFTADAGVTVAGLEFYTGHVYQAENAPVPHDCVRDGYFANGANNGYYCIATVKNVTFEGIDFVASVDIQNSRPETDFDGLTFKDCSFTTGSTDICIHIGNWSDADNYKVFKNLLVENCKFNDGTQGVYCNPVIGVKVIGSTFENLSSIAVNLQTGSIGMNIPYGVSEISGNTFTNIADRVIRINNLSAETELTIKDNVSTDSGRPDTDGRSVVKAGNLEDGIVYHISNNNWNGGTGIVENEELKDKE